MRSPLIMAASWCVEGVPREVETEDDEQRAGRERRAGDPGPRAVPPAVRELDEDGEPRKDAETHAEGEAAGPGRRGHQEPVPDEEGDEERPVQEERGVRGALQEAGEDRKPQSALLRGGRRRDEGQA